MPALTNVLKRAIQLRLFIVSLFVSISAFLFLSLSLSFSTPLLSFLHLSFSTYLFLFFYTSLFLFLHISFSSSKSLYCHFSYSYILILQTYMTTQSSKQPLMWNFLHVNICTKTSRASLFVESLHYLHSKISLIPHHHNMKSV